MMKKIRLLTLFILLLLFPSVANFLNLQAQDTFAYEQLLNNRVLLAQIDKENTLRQEFALRGLTYPPKAIYLQAFKKEGLLEIWVLTEQGIYAKFKEYTICTSSGKLGPKRIQGDGQVPEGFYYINKFNPVSSFYLSLGINYPNDSDRIFGGYNPLGGDIYIHGDCKSVGCLPLTNEKMKEVYWLAVMACNNGQYRPPVHIFPMRFSNTELYMSEYAKATT